MTAANLDAGYRSLACAIILRAVRDAADPAHAQEAASFLVSPQCRTMTRLMGIRWQVTPDDVEGAARALRRRRLRRRKPMAMNRGVVTVQGALTFADTSPRLLFTLPQGATPLLAVLQVETAFDDSGTDLLALGIAGDGDYFAAALDVSAAGGQLVTLAQAPETARALGVTATYSGQNGDAAAGRAVVTLLYATPFEPR